ncbi:hypothetical protein FQA39_LY05095 [Lamprigera yunnana]|nr:hypothetical protein FQA39_LY05095 [Lamprigera yunnana]
MRNKPTNQTPLLVKKATKTKKQTPQVDKINQTAQTEIRKAPNKLQWLWGRITKRNTQTLRAEQNKPIETDQEEATTGDSDNMQDPTISDNNKTETDQGEANIRDSTNILESTNKYTITNRSYTTLRGHRK